MRCFLIIFLLSMFVGCGEREDRADGLLFLSCIQTGDNFEPRTNIHRYDLLQNTHAWWNLEHDSGPRWEVFSCSAENHHCAFDDAELFHEWKAGDLAASRTRINRVTGKGTFENYTRDSGWGSSFLECKPVGNPVKNLEREF